MLTPPPADFVAAVSDVLSQAQKIYLTTHVGPDGDAIGTALAWKLALEAVGKEVVYVCKDGVPTSNRFLPHQEDVLLAPPPGFIPDAVFILDCDGTPDRVASPYPIIENCAIRVLIDHHRSSNPIFEHNWIEPTQPATSMMVFKLICELGWQITPDMAECLLCGLSTDTGHFRFPNTTPETLEVAGRLVECGADPALTSFKLFSERSFAGTQLLGLSLCNMKSELDDRLVYTVLSAKEFSSIGTGDESSENVVNYLRDVRNCQMAIIFRERRDEQGQVVRISVRAEPALRADLFCALFGGGGHAAASGCRQRGELKEVVQRVVDRAKAWLQEDHPKPPV